MYLKQCLVTSNVEYFKGEVGDIIKSHKTIKKYAYILHDKDPGQSPHWTIYLNFGRSGVDIKQIAEWFGLQESQVEKIKGRMTDALQYLTHSNDTQQNKYQYSSDEVIANFDFQTEIKNAKILGDFEHFSYAQQLQYVNSLPVSEKSSAFRQLENLWRLQCKYLSLQSDRQLEVIFIWGPSGSGKTYYAKKLLSKMGYDYCISSSSNDPFQDYLGQKAMILDDLRDKSFAFEDLLKILDNNTVSSVQSRFQNKVFNGVLILITSSVPLRYWYRGLQIEDLKQLYRRIGCYVEISKEEISVFSEIGADGRPKGVAQVYKNELFGKTEEATVKTDFGALFGQICEAVTDSPFDGQAEQLKIIPDVGKK